MTAIPFDKVIITALLVEGPFLKLTWLALSPSVTVLDMERSAVLLTWEDQSLVLKLVAILVVDLSSCAVDPVKDSMLVTQLAMLN